MQNWNRLYVILRIIDKITFAGFMVFKFKYMDMKYLIVICLFLAFGCNNAGTKKSATVVNRLFRKT